MKFKDPKTGEVFEDIADAFVYEYCCKYRRRGCVCCPWRDRGVGQFGTCYIFATTHPAEAARLMGYEVVEEESTVIINANKDEGLEAKRAAMRPDEYIVCTNATVIMDSSGKLSYFENGAPVCMIETEE